MLNQKTSAKDRRGKGQVLGNSKKEIVVLNWDARINVRDCISTRILSIKRQYLYNDGQEKGKHRHAELKKTDN